MVYCMAIRILFGNGEFCSSIDFFDKIPFNFILSNEYGVLENVMEIYIFLLRSWEIWPPQQPPYWQFELAWGRKTRILSTYYVEN